MQEEVTIELDEHLSPEAMDQIDLFRQRFRELRDNWGSLMSQGITLDGHHTRRSSGEIIGSNCGIERHRLKDFYLDFRFFWAEKERTNYKKISNLLGKHCSDRRLQKVLKENKKDWDNANCLEGWHEFSPDDIIGALFNGKLFHSDSTANTKEKLKKINQIMNDDLTHYFLTYCIYDRMLVIRNINWILTPLSKENQMIRCPVLDRKSGSEH